MAFDLNLFWFISELGMLAQKMGAGEGKWYLSCEEGVIVCQGGGYKYRLRPWADISRARRILAREGLPAGVVAGVESGLLWAAWSDEGWNGVAPKDGTMEERREFLGDLLMEALDDHRFEVPADDELCQAAELIIPELVNRILR